MPVQERLTTQVADAIYNALEPHVVAVEIDAEHLCMALRGIKKPGSKIVTSKASGLMKSDSKFRDEFYSLISS